MAYKMYVEEVAPKIFAVKMTNPRILAKTFMRFQEHYESPYEEIRLKVFSRDTFKEVYKENRGDKKFTYETDWCGFNIPSWVLDPFIEGKFDPLLKCEQKLVDTFKDCGHDKFYVIGSVNNSFSTINDVLQHEISHGLWYTNDEYREAQQDSLKYIEGLNDIKEYIFDLGYHPDVLEDEAHAYLMTCQDHILHVGKGDLLCVNEDIIYEMAHMYNRYSPVKIGIKQKCAQQ